MYNLQFWWAWRVLWVEWPSSAPPPARNMIWWVSPKDKQTSAFLRGHMTQAKDAIGILVWSLKSYCSCITIKSRFHTFIILLYSALSCTWILKVLSNFIISNCWFTYSCSTTGWDVYVQHSIRIKGRTQLRSSTFLWRLSARRITCILFVQRWGTHRAVSLLRSRGLPGEQDELGAVLL